MTAKEEFVQYASSLAAGGFLTDPAELVWNKEGTLYFLKEGCSLPSLSVGDVLETAPETINDNNPVIKQFRRILSSNMKARAVMISRGKYTETAALAGRKVYPLLDDFAQMLGTAVKVCKLEKASKTIKDNGAVLIKDEGGLCCAGNLYDLHSTAMVLEKGCQAQVDSWFLGGGKKISFFGALLMRYIYLKKYSKGAGKE